MTSEQVKALSNNKLRIKVAKLLGIERVVQKDDPWWGFDGKRYFTIPDYPNDLNAMHEAEKSLGSKTIQYARTLSDLAAQTRLIKTDIYDKYWVAFSIARQRAEAFVLTMEKVNGES